MHTSPSTLPDKRRGRLRQTFRSVLSSKGAPDSFKLFAQRAPSPRILPTISSSNTTSLPQPTRHVDTAQSLWDIALKRLSDDERNAITEQDLYGKLDVIQVLYNDVLQQKRDCEQSKLTFELNGRRVALRDLADKAIAWIDKFKEIGDVAANFDPIHAALPWAGVRLLLQTAVIEVKQRLAILVGVEKVSSIITRCSIYELLYLHGQPASQCTLNLRATLINLYVLVFTFLLAARRLNAKSHASRTAHAIFQPVEALAFVEKCEKLETCVAHDASICESSRACERGERLTKEVEHLNTLLHSFEQPIGRLDSNVDTLLTAIHASKQAEVLQWISSIPHKDSHSTARTGRTDGTGNWLLGHDSFCDWRRSKSSMALWLHGPRMLSIFFR